MTDFQRFVVVWAGSTGLMFIGLMLIAGLVVVSDRVVVSVLRAFGIRRFYRTAMQIAAIIESEADGWRLERYRATHKAIGTINLLVGLKVETPQGTWEPNRIERRIIRSALERTMTARVGERVARAARSA
jgi:hypothetical protein